MSDASANLLQQVNQMVEARQSAQLNDRQLLHRFAAQRDEASFAAVLRRHGPMVLGVCRRLLGHEQDAEDAFQAVFLLLARKAGAIREADVGGWLYRVAHRLAIRARAKAGKRVGAACRAALASPARLAGPTDDPLDEVSWREVRSMVDEELQRLPAALRSAVVLHYLEGHTHQEAARLLGWSKNTLRRRLDRGRELLRARLLGRGLAPTAALAASLFADGAATASVSVALRQVTIRTALGAPASPTIAALVKSASPILNVGKAKLAVLLLLIAAGGGSLIGSYRRTNAPLAAAPEPPKNSPASSQKKNDVAVSQGRVLLPNGKPAANATILRRETKPDATGIEYIALTSTGSDGRFRIEQHKGAKILLATKPGFAPDWTESKRQGGDLTLTLAERATVRGRLVSLEGKPIAGAKVKVLAVRVPIRGNLNAVKEAFRLNPEWTDMAMSKSLYGPIPDSTAETKTDADGRFELDGYGKNRVLILRIEGDGIVSEKVHVVLTEDFDPKSIVRRPGDRPGSFSPNYRPTVYGPRFTHAVRPCQIITGTVTDDATGKPIVGAKVIGTAGSIRQYDTSAWHDAVEAVTDREGRYRLNGLPKAKSRHLHAQPGDAPYLDRLVDVQDVPALAPIRVDIKLHRAVVIEGRLLDKATGKGVRGFVVCLPLRNEALTRFLLTNPLYDLLYAVNPSGMHAPTDANGRFRLRAPPVPLVILARAGAAGHSVIPYTPVRVAKADRKYLRKPVNGETPTMMVRRLAQEEFFDTQVGHPLHWYNGYALAEPKEAKETVKVSIAFDGGRTIQGKIVGPDGLPLAGVQVAGVQATGEDEPTNFPTDAFTVSALDPTRPRTVYFRHKTKNLIATAMLRGDETEAPLVKMQPAASVVGRVVDANGKPLAEMEVTIQFSEFGPDEQIRQTLLGAGTERLTTTDADGRFRLDGMFPGLEFTVYAGHPGHRSSPISFDPVTLKAGEGRDLGTTKPKPIPKEEDE